MQHIKIRKSIKWTPSYITEHIRTQHPTPSHQYAAIILLLVISMNHRASCNSSTSFRSYLVASTNAENFKINFHNFFISSRPKPNFNWTKLNYIELTSSRKKKHYFVLNLYEFRKHIFHSPTQCSTTWAASTGRLVIGKSSSATQSIVDATI